MPTVNYVTDLWWLFYNFHETVIVSNVYLFYVSFASLGLQGAGLGLGTDGLHYETK